MCIHSFKDLMEQQDHYRGLPNYKHVACVAVFRKWGRVESFQGGTIIDACDAQAVANTIEDLKRWHPAGTLRVEMKYVDEVRRAFNLRELDDAGLPKANRPAQEELDKQLIRIDPGYAKLSDQLQSAQMAAFMIQQIERQAVAA